MSSGGGGQEGITRYDWNPVVGGYWGDGTNGILNWGYQEALKPYQQYGAQRIADRNTDQYRGAQQIRDMADDGSWMNKNAETQLVSTMLGEGLDNPWDKGNVFATQGNKYADENPYFRQTLQTGLSDIADAYKQGTSADTTRMFQMGGALGGSAHHNAQANNESALAKQMGNFTNQMLQSQYDRSVGLEEGRLNRATQSEESRLGRGASMYDSERGRMMGAAQLGLGGDKIEIDRANALMGIGNWEQQEQQKHLDQNYTDWTNGMNWGRNNINWLANLISQAQGTTGTTTQTSGYQGISPGAGLLSAASLYGALR